MKNNRRGRPQKYFSEAERKQARKQWNKKYYRKVQNRNISVHSAYRNIEEVKEHLLFPLPAPSIVKKLEPSIKQKHHRFFTVMADKVITTFLLQYFAENHFIMKDAKVFFNHMNSQKFFKTNKTKDLVEFLWEKTYYGNYEEHINAGYYWKYEMEWVFLKYNDAKEYLRYMYKLDYDKLNELASKSTDNPGIPSLRFFLAIKNCFKNYNIDTIYSDDFVKCINMQTISKKRIKELPVTQKMIVTMFKNINEETFQRAKERIKFTGEEDFVEKLISSIKNFTLEDIVNVYIKVKEKKYNKLKEYIDNFIVETLEDVSFKNILEYKLRRMNNKIIDAKRVLKYINKNEIIVHTSKKYGREYNLFTTIPKDLRNILLGAMGYTYEIDLKNGMFQLLMEDEQRLFGSDVLEYFYKNVEDLANKYAMEVKENKQLKRKPYKRVRKIIKEMAIINLNKYHGFPFINNVLRTYLSEESLKELELLMRDIKLIGNALSDYYFENYNYKYEIPGLTLENALFYRYIEKEEEVINELAKEFHTFVRIHDAIYVKAGQKAVFENIKKQKYVYKTSKLIDYENFIKDYFSGNINF